MKTLFLKITFNLKGLINSLPLSERKKTISGLMLYISLFKRWSTRKPKEAVSFEATKMVDNFIKEVNPDVKISCRKGCSFCCYVFVDINEGEAINILKYVEKNNIVVDWERIECQSTSENKFLNDIPFKSRRCGFLNSKNECSIYPARPISCRKYFVVSHPEDCNTENKTSHQTLNYVVEKAEIVASAIVQTQNSGLMAKMLLEAKKNIKNP